MNILVSACLLGVPCRYDGTGKLEESLEILMQKHHLVPICPEVFGGLPTPRDPAERIEDKILTKSGEDVTKYYEIGACEILKLAKMFNCKYAVLKERSPSCGYGKIYDGTFSGNLVKGNGVLAELLLENGITLIGESDKSALEKLIRS
jgi:uncharacterized protein YbbK (DUF523 family)